MPLDSISYLYLDGWHVVTSRALSTLVVKATVLFCADVIASGNTQKGFAGKQNNTTAFDSFRPRVNRFVVRERLALPAGARFMANRKAVVRPKSSIPFSASNAPKNPEVAVMTQARACKDGSSEHAHALARDPKRPVIVHFFYGPRCIYAEGLSTSTIFAGRRHQQLDFKSRKYRFFGSGFSAEAGFVQPRPSNVAEDDRALSSPAPHLQVVLELFLDLRLGRPCGRSVAFTKTLAASAIPPLDETRSKIIAPTIAANQFV